LLTCSYPHNRRLFSCSHHQQKEVIRRSLSCTHPLYCRRAWS
jgi:hypothetical protein